MKKTRIVTAALAGVTLIAGLVVGAGFLRDGRAEKKKEESAFSMKNEMAELVYLQYRFEGLENLYYLSDNTEQFKKDLADFLKEEGLEAETVTGLAYHEDDITKEDGYGHFFMELDDAEKTLLDVFFDHENGAYTFAVSEQEVPGSGKAEQAEEEQKQKKEREQERELEAAMEEEVLDLGAPVIEDNEGELAVFEPDMEGMKAALLQFLQSRGEERRNFSVRYAQEFDGGYECELVFENARADGKDVRMVCYTLTGQYQVMFTP